MSLLAGFILTSDPVQWHLQYWLNIEVVGVLRGEDITLMAFRVENEIRNIERAQIRDGVHQAWGDFHRNNTQRYQLEWQQKTLASQEAQPYLRDIDRMLVNKEQKTRDYVHQMERDLFDWRRRVQAEMTEKVTKIGQLYRKLANENLADQERARRLQATNEMENDVYNQEEETPAATEVEAAGAENQPPRHGENEVHHQEETAAATEVEAAGAGNQPLHGENEAHNQEERTPAATVETARPRNQLLDAAHYEEERASEEEEWRQLQQEINDFNVFADIEE